MLMKFNSSKIYIGLLGFLKLYLYTNKGYKD